MMGIRADQAKPGDRTAYGTTVQRRDPNGPRHVLLHTLTDDGEPREEVWLADDDITQGA